MAEELRLLQTQADLAEGRFSRKDGRKFNSHRPLESTIGSLNTADGSCLVRLGNTCVICGIRGEIAEKTIVWDSKIDLDVGVEVKLPFKNIGQTGPSEEEQNLSQQLQTLLVSNEIIRPEKFSDKFFWVLHVSITCLDYDGNLFGAAVAAITGALSNLRLPKVFYDKDTERLEVDVNNEKVDSDQPIAVSYGIINDQIVVDMTYEESMLAGGESYVVYSQDGTLLHLHKGGVPMTDVKRIESILADAKKTATSLRAMLDL